MQTAFYFDQSRCIGCYNCVAACRSWNQLDQEMPDLIQIVSHEQGEYPNVSLSRLFLTCFHCAEPPCILACPEKILLKRTEDGIVVISDPKQCTGCKICIEACPYGALKTVSKGEINLVKCNMCLDRLSKGKSLACVASCPTEALDAGPLQELTARYGDTREIEGFTYHTKADPSIIFRIINVVK